MNFSNYRTQARVLLAVFLIGFLLGFMPMWLRARQRTSERDQALQKLQTSELKGQLSAAALDARRGKYEVAREELSGFFAFLNTALARTGVAHVTPEELKSLQPVLAEHDELITLLARNDPASADRLSNLDLTFRKALAHP